MKRSLYNSIPFIAVCAIVALILASHTFAQEPEINIDATADDSAQPINERMIQKTEERAELKEERRATLEAKFQERIINLSANVTRRLSAGNERMLNIIGRLETRIDKLNALGVDTESAKAKLAEAKSSVEKTSEIIAGFESVQSAIGSDTPRESFAAIRTQFTDARISLNTTHALLRETVALLKTAVEASELGQGVSDAVSNSTATSESSDVETTEAQ